MNYQFFWSCNSMLAQNVSFVYYINWDSSTQNLYKMTLIVTYLVSLISTSGLNWSKIMSAKSSFNAKTQEHVVTKMTGLWFEEKNLIRKRSQFFYSAKSQRIILTSNDLTNFLNMNLFQIYRRATFRVKETEVASDSPNSITG